MDLFGREVRLGGPELDLRLVVRLAVRQLPHAVRAGRLRAQRLDRRDHFLDARLERALERGRALVEQALLGGVVGLELLHLAAEVREDRGVLAAVVEGRAGDDAAVVADHGIEREGGRHDAAARGFVHDDDALFHGLLHALEARDVGLGILDAVHAVDVLHEGRGLADRVRLRLESVAVEAPGEGVDRRLRLHLEDPVADLHRFGQLGVVELGVQALEVLLVEAVLALRLLVREVVPLAVVRSLHAEVGLEDRAVLDAALEHFLEERREARVLGRRRRGGSLLGGRRHRGKHGQHEAAGERGNSSGQGSHSDLLGGTGSQTSGAGPRAQRVSSRRSGGSSQEPVRTQAGHLRRTQNKWWLGRESNSRPRGYESRALTS